jgi:hypothetical protein
MPKSVSDYGGGNYKRGRISGGGPNTRSMRCVRCQTLRYVLNRELSRAARPRCLKCGGAIEEIDVSRERQGLLKKEAFQKEYAKKVPEDEDKVIRCVGCGMSFRAMERAIDRPLEEYLTVHLEGNPTCTDAYAEEDSIIDMGGKRLAIIPTIHPYKFMPQEWRVCGISPNAEKTFFSSHKTQREAIEAIDTIFKDSRIHI